MKLNVHLSLDDHSITLLNSILSAVERLEQRFEKEDKTLMANLAALQAEVARNTSVEKSALALIQGLAAQIIAAGTDPVALQAIVDQLAQNDAELAKAVSDNTPAAPPAETPAS